MKNYLNESLSAQERAEALVNEMTVEEAASQLMTLLLLSGSAFLPITGGMRVSMGLHEAVWPPCFHRQ